VKPVSSALLPGAKRAQVLMDNITDLNAAFVNLQDELPSVNDEELRPRVMAFIKASEDVLITHATEPGPDIADELNQLLNGVRELDIPACDPDLGVTPTLERLERATGILAIRLMKTLDAAAAMGWLPKHAQLPEKLSTSIARDEVGSLLTRIGDRLDRVTASLDELLVASEATTEFLQQKGLVEFYTGSVRVQVDLARMQLTVGKTTVDFAALWRTSEAIAELTGDFIATVQAWAKRVSESIAQAAEKVRWQVRRVVSGIGTVAKFVARKRRKADHINETDDTAEHHDEDPTPILSQIMPRVFIAYVRENADLVDRLARELKSRGVTVWLDRNDIEPGARWRDSIKDAIHRGTFFLACFSREYNERDRSYMSEELTLAIDELRARPSTHTWFIPILINETMIPSLRISSTVDLSDIQAVKLYENWDEGVRHILRVLKYDDPVSARIYHLINLLELPFYSERMYALHQLQDCGPAAASAVPALAEALKDHDPGIRRSAADALGGIGPAAASAVPALAEALKDQHASVRQSAANALGGIGPAAAKASRQKS
jgi:TIR domain/HEAT repeats